MAVPGRGHRNAGGKVQKLIAIHILNPQPTSALGHQWVAARVAGGHQRLIAGHHRCRLRSGQRALQLRSKLRMQCLAIHPVSPSCSRCSRIRSCRCRAWQRFRSLRSHAHAPHPQPDRQTHSCALPPGNAENKRKLIAGEEIGTALAGPGQAGKRMQGCCPAMNSAHVCPWRLHHRFDPRSAI